MAFVLTNVFTLCNDSYMNTNIAAAAASDLVARLVAKGMTTQDAANLVVTRMITERPELAAKVFAGLVAA